MFNNAKTMLNMYSAMGNNSDKKDEEKNIKTTKENNVKSEEKVTKKINKNSSLTFFQ